MEELKLQKFKIPNVLNIVLVIACAMMSYVFLVLASSTDSLVFKSILILFFSAVFLTNYSLYHEASHHKLHSDPKWNYALGVVAGMFFLCPFSIFYVTHWNHHLRNRTDYEMFDLYYENKRVFKTFFKWYAYLFGMWFWMIPPGALIIAFGPQGLRRKLMRKEVGFVNFDATDSRTFNLTRARIEVLLTVAFMGALVKFGGVSLGTFLLFYGVGSIWWSTTQYVDHAYADRDVMLGAYNLKASRWFSLVNLHREFDLNHHLFPEISWIHLPALKTQIQQKVEDGKSRKRFFKHYLSQWKGPVLASNSVYANAPHPIKEVQCDYNTIVS